MSKLQQLENEAAVIQERVRREISQLSEDFKLRLQKAAGFEEAFSSAFEGYIQNDLPKDEAYFKLEAEAEQKKKIDAAKKEKKLNILDKPSVLPKI